MNVSSAQFRPTMPAVNSTAGSWGYDPRDSFTATAFVTFPARDDGIVQRYIEEASDAELRHMMRSAQMYNHGLRHTSKDGSAFGAISPGELYMAALLELEVRRA
jgi:hypothetical protein